MTYSIQVYACPRPVLATNCKVTAHRFAQALAGCAVAGVQDGVEVGCAFMLRGRRASLASPSPVSHLYLAHLKSKHGFIELPSFTWRAVPEWSQRAIDQLSAECLS